VDEHAVEKVWGKKVPLGKTIRPAAEAPKLELRSQRTDEDEKGTNPQDELATQRPRRLLEHESLRSR